MGIIARYLLLTTLAMGCSSTVPPAPISRARWVECWTLCGKADNLVSVTAVKCVCKGGVKVEKDDEPEAEAPVKSEPFELFDWLMK